MATTAAFNHIDLASQPAGTVKPWTKVDAGGMSYTHLQVSRPVHNLRDESPAEFNTDISGFGTFSWPSAERDFVDDAAVRGRYYDDVEALLRDNCEKLPLETFTIREMANERAGELFLKNSKVDRRFAQPGDVFWWQCNAIPEHKKAAAAARKPGRLYEAALQAYDMNDRLGWDQLIVNVHEVDDIKGPVNF
ncbi:hypothetical protein O1611_g1045 [Lasiodiplodia mahajangana]|uniref:Uncharacterized protein n=1 Tax=Lasiodiplodia mahajangana TaxID=1108764 RepID=A0ACC2JYI2_9PEZI|nr:hypothetical protein O1611_g1045 [Lasiodiplodia mahajangana]